MPFLALMHLRDVVCRQCGAVVAPAGARSFVVGDGGAPRLFDAEDPPAELRVRIECPNAHPVELLIPSDVGAEEVSTIPDGAPIAADAAVVSGTTESGTTL